MIAGDLGIDCASLQAVNASLHAAILALLGIITRLLMNRNDRK